MADEGHIELSVAVNTEAFDDWVRALRLLVSHIGFALDGYLADRPTAAPQPEG